MGAIKETAFGVLTGASLALNVLLGYVYLSAGPSHSRGPASEPASPSIGTPQPPLQLEDLTGRATELSYGSHSLDTVLYVISPHCNWCKVNTPSIRSLAEQASSAYRFVALTTTSAGLDVYLSDHSPGFEVAGVVSQSKLRSLGYSGTPFTAVISRDGSLVAYWRGAYTGSTARSVERFFKTKLPKLTKSKGYAKVTV